MYLSTLANLFFNIRCEIWASRRYQFKCNAQRCAIFRLFRQVLCLTVKYKFPHFTVFSITISLNYELAVVVSMIIYIVCSRRLLLVVRLSLRAHCPRGCLMMSDDGRQKGSAWFTCQSHGSMCDRNRHEKNRVAYLLGHTIRH